MAASCAAPSCGCTPRPCAIAGRSPSIVICPGSSNLKRSTPLNRSCDMSTTDVAIATECPTPHRYTPRRRDRRQALGALLTALTQSLDRRLDVSLMRGEFEDTLRRLLPVRSIQLRDTGSRWAGRMEDPGAMESIALEVPAADPALGGQLEATFDPGCCLGEWDFQTLGLAAHAGALVLEIERLR